MNTILVTKATENELQLLQDISRQTFYETFSGQNTETDMKRYLEENLSLERLKEEFLNAQSHFYFASLNGQTVGYLKLNTGNAQTEEAGEDAMEIERIYVLGKYQGIRAGQALLDTAIEIAKEHHKKQVWLGVWEKNTRATGFYQRNGFVSFGKHLFVLGADEQTDILMRLNLL